MAVAAPASHQVAYLLTLQERLHFIRFLIHRAKLVMCYVLVRGKDVGE